ncbi:hypothetical protein MYAM1_000339 [Malassezia yamatoensis]|uniref:LIM zinc-binding domain-containing protein n=1 Tax=Malassezia yamatoensis TaxID=253288 RepID=A0AAJ5YPX4_9BASI|nr:hypothetical protein MYAM1_000339 [Malassezia yamatoensis]
MEYSQARNLAVPNFAGIGVRRLLHDPDVRENSVPAVSINDDSFRSVARSEWFPDDDESVLNLSHSRLSCGRFPRFARATSNPSSIRVATPTPVLLSPPGRSFSKDSSSAKYDNSPSMSSSHLPQRNQQSYLPMHLNNHRQSPLKKPVRGPTTAQTSSEYSSPHQSPDMGPRIVSHTSSLPDLSKDSHHTQSIASKSRPQSPLAKTERKLKLETFVRDNGKYHAVHRPPHSLHPQTSTAVSSPLMKSFTESPLEDEASRVPASIRGVDEDRGTSVTPTRNSLLVIDSRSGSSVTDTRDMWELGTTSGRSEGTAATSLDQRVSPKSDGSQDVSPGLPVIPSRHSQSEASRGRELRQSGLDAIDAFLWSSSLLQDASDDDSFDPSTQRPYPPQELHPSTTSSVVHSPVHFATDDSDLAPQSAMDEHTVTPVTNTEPEFARNPDKVRSSRTMENEFTNADSIDDLLVEEWINRRLSAIPARSMHPTSRDTQIVSYGPNECNRCHQRIETCKIRSADGKLSGVYHPECFHCFACPKDLRNEEFYVLDDQPFCYQHYHEACDTFCIQCGKGIEGIYREAKNLKYHVHCFTCAHIDPQGNVCGKLLDEYYEVGDRLFCETHVLNVFKATLPSHAAKPYNHNLSIDPPSVQNLKRRSALLSTLVSS